MGPSIGTDILEKRNLLPLPYTKPRLQEGPVAAQWLLSYPGSIWLDVYNILKVKCTLVQALRLCTGRTAHRRSRGITLLFLDHGTRRGEVSVSHPGRFLPPGKTRYPLYRRLDGPQGRSGQVRKISPPPGFDPGPSSP